jgi:uncharacterized SAM-binding protein YcdF (DUF218 family)
VFLLKKTLSIFISPIVICLCLGIFAYVYHRKKETKKCRLFTGLAIACFLMFSWPPFGKLILTPLESSYKPVLHNELAVSTIVVLGSGHNSDVEYSANTQLCRTAHSRLLEGLRLSQLYPHSKVLFTGFGGHDEKSHAEIIAQAAVEQGLNPKRILMAPNARDTMEEADAALKLLDDKQILLVTEASHMKRALKIFADREFVVSPSPGQFYTTGKFDLFQMPQADGLRMTERAFHEYCGLTWAYTKAIFAD